AAWLGLKACWLKLETMHPTGTFKDRITELTYAFFRQEGVACYSHCSAGNTATSLVWGLKRYARPFALHLFVAEEQLPYHNFQSDPALRVTLLAGAGYQQAKRYAAWYARSIGQPEHFGFNSPVRQEGNKLPYLEALAQCRRERIEPDLICQVISDGSGTKGAALAAADALAAGWLKRQPALCAFQPAAANPMVRAFRSGRSTYDHSCDAELQPSKASFIRRSDASGSYEAVYQAVSQSGGFLEDAAEGEIEAARQALMGLEGINAGYTSCVALAGLKKRAAADQALAGVSALVMLTGIDRQAVAFAPADEILPREAWQKVIG
ncbi:MAG TPA: pyridoxal-phosphate dependent enzyme, partial [Patescibacteria group bacterium]|nr:pyridoxal-phosphate dependent enzyme [Patescibacteria group bacterium]